MDPNYNYGLTPDPQGASLRAAVGGQTAFDPSAITSTPAPASGFSSLLPASNAKYVEKDGKHRGGAGVARDILGFLGDFLLTRLHMKPMYSEAQKDRKEQAALEGFGADPQSTADALSRLGSINPARRDKLTDQLIDNTRLNQNAQSMQEARAERLRIQTEAADNKKRLIGLQGLNSITRVKDDAERATLYPSVRAQILKVAPGMADELPEKYDPGVVDTLLDSGVTLGLQRGQRLTELKNAATDENADQRLGETVRHNKRTESLGEERVATTRRGQDIVSGDKAKGREVTIRGQDMRPKPRPPKPQPTEQDLAYIRKHPEMKDRFDGRFGVGMTKKVLGE